MDTTELRERASSVWSSLWNPPTNEWEPSADPLDPTTAAFGEPSHEDEPTAEPMSEQPGHAPSGTVPDPRANLLTDVRDRAAQAGPETVVRHYVTTIDKSADLVVGRVVRVVGAAGVGDSSPTVLLTANPNRTRALIKPITTNGVIMLQPFNQGGNLPQTGVPAAPMSAYPIATGDPVHEVKSGAAVEAYAAGTTDFVDVAIWEEITGADNVGGLI